MSVCFNGFAFGVGLRLCFVCIFFAGVECEVVWSGGSALLDYALKELQTLTFRWLCFPTFNHTEILLATKFGISENVTIFRATILNCDVAAKVPGLNNI